MIKRLVTMVTCSVLSLIGAVEVAQSDVIGRYECNALGVSTPEPIGDRPGHGLAQCQFSCVGVEGLRKGAVHSAMNVSEWDGPTGKLVLVGGVHRTPGGLALTKCRKEPQRSR